MAKVSVVNLVEQGVTWTMATLDRAKASYSSYLDSTSVAELDVSQSGRALPEGRCGRPELRLARKVWYEALVPELRARELERAKAKRLFFQRAVPVGVAALVLTILIARIFPAIHLLVVVGGFAFATLTASHRTRLARIGYDAKSLIVEAACELYGFTFNPLPFKRPALFDFLKYHERQKSDCPTPAFDVLNRYGLMPTYSYNVFEDGVSGSRAGVDFSIVEARLRIQSNKSAPIVFQGILIHIAYPERFLGRTVLCRRSEVRKLRRQRKDLKPVDIVAPEFESTFLVFTDDQVEARALLTPDRLMRLIALERYFPDGKLRAVFEDGHMTIAIEAKDMFEVGSAWKTLVDESRFADCLHELGLICDVLDGYLTRDWSARRAG